MLTAAGHIQPAYIMNALLVILYSNYCMAEHTNPIGKLFVPTMKRLREKYLIHI